MNFSLQRLKAVIKKEFIQLKRDRSTLGLIVMLPILQLLLFGYAINNDPKNLPTATGTGYCSSTTSNLIACWRKRFWRSRAFRLKLSRTVARRLRRSPSTRPAITTLCLWISKCR